MDKSKVCITKAMKYAKPACNRKQNLLVFKKDDPCYPQPKRKEFYTAIPLACANAKKIKVCTGADLKKMCRPKLCNCPPKKFHGPAACAAIVIGWTLKGGFTMAIIYWTYALGIWGPPTQTENIYFNMCKSMFHSKRLDRLEAEMRREKMIAKCPALENAICPKDYTIDGEPCKYPPNLDSLFFKWAEMWNCAVTFSFDLLANWPQRMMDLWVYINKRIDKFKGISNEECKGPDPATLTKCKINRS